MEKIILMLLFGLILSLKVLAKDERLNLKYAETEHTSTTHGWLAPRLYDASKIKSRLCYAAGAVVAGSGGIVFLFAGIFNGIATERDPAKVSKLRRQQYTRMAIGGGIALSGIPLFLLGRHYRKQETQETVFHFKMEPVDGYQGQPTAVAAVGISIGL